ncbi:MAG: translation initiation factor IF-3 [Deltaproteobacteria bacterium]|nr:translation initiation factor IF-3 [Deltaproteobacteria bacterium]
MRPPDSQQSGPGQKPGPGGQQRSNELRVNRRIRVKEVFVIDADGQKLGVVQTDDALKRAMELGLDLVEVNPMSRPPVCKLMDYGKYKYDQKKKAAVAKKNQKIIELKEVKLRPKTDDHDFNFKVDHIRRFLGEGNKAKVTIMFRGREITHPEIGKQVLDRVIESVKDIAMMEQFPRMEGRNMYMIIAPGKGGVRPVTPAGPSAGAPAAAAPQAPRPPPPAGRPPEGGVPSAPPQGSPSRGP